MKIDIPVPEIERRFIGVTTFNIEYRRKSWYVMDKVGVYLSLRCIVSLVDESCDSLTNSPCLMRQKQVTVFIDITQTLTHDTWQGTRDFLDLSGIWFLQKFL